MKSLYPTTETTAASMIALILFTIILGATIGVLFHLRQIVNHVPIMTRDIPLVKETPEEHNRRMDDMMARWKEESEEAKKKYAERRAYLDSAETLTDEEKEELETMKAKELHVMEHAAIRKGEIPNYDIDDIYSPEVQRKERERQITWDKDLRTKIEECTDEKERGMMQMLVGMNAPSALGMNLTSKNPNFRRWDTEAEARATAKVGDIFEWMSCEVMREPLQEKTFHLIRTSGPHRWIYLTVTREKTESLKDILTEYVKTLKKEQTLNFVCHIMGQAEVASSWKI